MLLGAKRKYHASRATQEALRAYLSCELQPGKLRFHSSRFLVADLETTALAVDEGEIASIAWVEIADGAIQLDTAQHHLIRIDGSVGQSAVYHQLHDEELEAAEPIETALEAFLGAASGKVLVFHNAELDMGFLNKAMRTWADAPLISQVVDTLQLEKRKLLKRHDVIEPGALRLFNCRARYGLDDYPAHDALVDALATAELLLAIAAHYGERCQLRDLT
jgi:DNA polymerase-3 subunit epsilon